MHEFFKSIMDFVISEAGAILGTVAVSLGGVALLKLKTGWKKLRKYYSISHLVETDIEIYTQLSDLMISCGAVRAFVFQFHNGVFYLNASTQMKMSNTHEVTQEGFSKEGKNMQDILLSLYPMSISEIVKQDYAIFDTEHCAPYDFCQLLKNHGIKIAFISKIMSKDTMEGFVGIGYWEGQDIKFTETRKALIGRMVEEHAGKIGFLLKDRR